MSNTGGRYGLPQSYGGNKSIPNTLQKPLRAMGKGDYKSNTLAYVLWFFLGFVGAHKFYLKQNIMGFSYIACTVLHLACIYSFNFGIFGYLLGTALIFDIYTIYIRVRELNDNNIY